MSSDPVQILTGRVEQLSAEIVVLRGVIAKMAAFADPRARVGLVQLLTNAPGSLPTASPRTPDQDAVILQTARALLSMIAR